MLDRHEVQNVGNGSKPNRADAANSDRQRADREVPLPGAESTLAVHQWLDGDLSEAEARRADAGQVEFWSRMASETDRRRRMTTPSHVMSQVMAALPDREVAVEGKQPTTKASGMKATSAVALGAGFFTLGMVVGRFFKR